MIVLGADTHRRSHTIAAVAAATGELLGEQTVAVGAKGWSSAPSRNGLKPVGQQSVATSAPPAADALSDTRAMADVLCPRCGAPLESEELWLMDTAVAFPALDRELTPAGPDRVCLNVRSCSDEGIQYARWHDRPHDQFRPIDANALRWID